MSKLEELIKEFCPNGVEYVKIGHICKSLPKGTLKTSELVEGGMYPVINAGKDLYGYYSQYNNNGDAFTLSSRGEYAGSVNYFENKFWAGGLCYPYTSSNPEICLTKFIYYYLKNIEKYIRYTMVAEGSIPALNKKDLQELQIPLPALPVQREIVRILDSFTLYSAELTAELTARRKQYEFYRDKLLNFDSGNIQRVKLKDICGKVSNIKWQNDDNEYAYIDLSSVDRETHKITIEQRINKENAPSRAQQIVNKGDVLFATTRPTLKRYCKITEEFNGQICSTGFVVLRPKINIILSTYLYYIVSSDRFFTYVEKNQEGTSYPAISDSKVKEFDFSLPPIDVQERIVKVLDNFDAICSDLGIGLPAEIEKRQKQYEYYRDKLLTF